MTSLSPPPPSPTPTRPVLLGLTVAVLIGHWIALGGGLPLWPGHSEGSLDNSDPTNTQPATSPTPADEERIAAAHALPTPVTISTVRWIVPVPPPPPPPPPPPRKAPAPKPSPLPELELAPIAVPDIEILPEPEPTWEPVEASAQEIEDLMGIETAELEPLTPSRPVLEIAPEPQASVSPPGAREGSSEFQVVLPPARLPPSATLSYEVIGLHKGFNYRASGELRWRQDGNSYELRQEVRAFLLGSRIYTSVGRVNPNGLAPDRFGDKNRSEKAAHFDRNKQRIRYSSNAREAPLLPGAQDQLSVSLQLGGLLNANPQYTQGQILDLPVTSAGSSEVWHFEIGPETTLDLPAGPVVARLLTRPPRREHDKTVQVWLAPALDHLPVRLKLTEPNGDFIDQLLVAVPALDRNDLN